MKKLMNLCVAIAIFGGSFCLTSCNKESKTTSISDFCGWWQVTSSLDYGDSMDNEPEERSVEGAYLYIEKSGTNSVNVTGYEKNGNSPSGISSWSLNENELYYYNCERDNYSSERFFLTITEVTAILENPNTLILNKFWVFREGASVDSLVDQRPPIYSISTATKLSGKPSSIL